MNTEMTYEAWAEKYKPISNHLDKNADETQVTFETFGVEVGFVLGVNYVDPSRVWTLVDGDEGTYIVDGFHYVNRLNYFVTDVGYEGEEGTFCMLDSEYGEEEDDEVESSEPVYAKLVFRENPPYGKDLPYGVETFSDPECLEGLDDMWFRSIEEREASVSAWQMIVIESTKETA